MLVNSSNSASSAVTGAIQQASQATGTSFNYLLATAQVELGLNPQAGASTSSARGLFQFIETTWLATIKQAGAALGFGRYADAITQTASGNYEVRDPTMRSEILKLRNDPNANALMAGAFTQGNASALSEPARPRPQRGRALHCAFSWGGRRGAADRPCRQQSQCQGHRLFSECGAGQPFDFLRSVDRRGPKPRPGARHPHRPL